MWLLLRIWLVNFGYELYSSIFFRIVATYFCFMLYSSTSIQILHRINTLCLLVHWKKIRHFLAYVLNSADPRIILFTNTMFSHLLLQQVKHNLNHSSVHHLLLSSYRSSFILLLCWPFFTSSITLKNVCQSYM